MSKAKTKVKTQAKSQVKRSILCVMLSVAMLFSMSAWTTASVAAESTVQPRYSYTNYIATGIYSEGLTVTCYTDMEGYKGTTTKIEVKMTLQEYYMFRWDDVMSWSATFNDYHCAMSRSLGVSRGDYRVKVEYKVYSGSQYEKITTYSQSEHV